MEGDMRCMAPARVDCCCAMYKRYMTDLSLLRVTKIGSPNGHTLTKYGDVVSWPSVEDFNLSNIERTDHKRIQYGKLAYRNCSGAIAYYDILLSILIVPSSILAGHRV